MSMDCFWDIVKEKMYKRPLPSLTIIISLLIEQISDYYRKTVIKWRLQGAIGFACHWLNKWCEIFKPITGRLHSQSLDILRQSYQNCYIMQHVFQGASSCSFRFGKIHR